MKAYVNWEWEQIFKTEVEAREFMVAQHICYTFAEYLINELDLSIEGIFDLPDDEKPKIYFDYMRYLNEAVKTYWESVEI